MLRSYLKFARRHLAKSPGYSLINIGGLALGIASVLLIFLYVQHEMSFDTYHENKERIYRVTSYSGFNEKRWGTYVNGAPLEEMRGSYAGVEDASYMINCAGPPVSVDGTDYRNLDLFCTEDNLFNIFSFPFVYGSPDGSLDAPHTAVISRSTAQRLFGDANPVGETFELNWRNEPTSFEITGVMEDIPVNTHFRYDILLSYESLRNTRRCLDCGQLMYTLLGEQADTAAIADRMLRHVREVDGKEHVEDIRLQSLDEVHFSSLHAQRKGDWQYIQILSAIALVILVLGCANYVNLAVARYSQRAKEIGVRKVMGAHRSQLTGQFLFETMLLTLAALPLALVMLYGAIPWFNRYAGTEVSLSLAGPVFYAALAGVLLVTGLLAGSYPALFVSGFNPREVLQGRNMGLGSALLRKGLVSFQFLAGIVMIGVTVLIVQQLNYAMQKDLGFDSDPLVNIQVNDPALVSQTDAVKSAFGMQASVEAVTASRAPATGGFTGISFTFDSDSVEGKRYTFATPRVDSDFIETTGIELLAGRNLRPYGEEGRQFPEEAVLNESAVEALGFTDNRDIIGREIGRRFRVVGVVEDFHMESLRNEIEPAALVNNPFGRSFSMTVRLAGNDIGEGLEDLHNAWTELGAETQLDYTFVDDLIRQQYENEQRTARVIGVFAGLSIIVACMGLFGLAAYTVQRRYREIGIRKVMGAGVGSIVFLLYRDFGKLIALAALVAVPVVYYAGSQWLENFAYRIDIGPMVLIWAVLAVVLVTLLATGYRSLQAALMNPVDSIRRE
ncbi:MAG: ABC transporter permease [Balneolaceae bacterium]|nr:ABC transporter permease [Balneolaceae bacterium]